MFAPPCTTPSPLFSTIPSPSELLLCGDFLDREGYSCVIVMQQGSAAWDDVNETAFSNEKLLWHVLKDKASTAWGVCLKFFNFSFAMLFWHIVCDQELSFFFPQMEASIAACSGLMLYVSLHFINFVNCALKGLS